MTAMNRLKVVLAVVLGAAASGVSLSALAVRHLYIATSTA